jgi:hypothetical protein
LVSWCVAVFLVMVAADWSCEEQQQMINWVLRILRMFSLLIPVLSPVGSFYTIIPILHNCSLFNLLGVAIPHLASHNRISWDTLWLLFLRIFLMVMSTLHHRQWWSCLQCTQKWQNTV